MVKCRNRLSEGEAYHEGCILSILTIIPVYIVAAAFENSMIAVYSRWHILLSTEDSNMEITYCYTPYICFCP